MTTSVPSPFPASLEVVDSHTEGEPTRVVLAGWPQPPGADMAARRRFLAAEQDLLRRAVVGEPRGHAALVGALLTPAVSADAECGVIFFDNAGLLGMCGHGLMGVVRTLAHLGRLSRREVCLDTPVGPVRARLEEAPGTVTIENVPARCHARDVPVDVPGLGRVRGDVAWGGNWFFLAEAAELGLRPEDLELSQTERLTQLATAIRRALAAAGVTGSQGAEIDHVELFGPARRPDAHSRNFVLCPGLAYDRSPCGTGTSAKLASLHARGRLAAGESWRQESIVGGLFEGWLEERAGELVPHLRGRAFVTAQARLHFDPADPFRAGFDADAGRS